MPYDLYRQIKRENDEAKQNERGLVLSEKQKKDFINLSKGFYLVQPKKRKGTLEMSFNMVERKEADKECAITFHTSRLLFNLQQTIPTS